MTTLYQVGLVSGVLLVCLVLYAIVISDGDEPPRGGRA